MKFKLLTEALDEFELSDIKHINTLVNSPEKAIELYKQTLQDLTDAVMSYKHEGYDSVPDEIHNSIDLIETPPDTIIPLKIDLRFSFGDSNERPFEKIRQYRPLQYKAYVEPLINRETNDRKLPVEDYHIKQLFWGYGFETIISRTSVGDYEVYVSGQYPRVFVGSSKHKIIQGVKDISDTIIRCSEEYMNYLRDSIRPIEIDWSKLKYEN